MKTCNRRKENGQTIWVDLIGVEVEGDREVTECTPFQNYLFWTYINKITTFAFWCVVIPIGSHSVYT